MAEKGWEWNRESILNSVEPLVKMESKIFKFNCYPLSYLVHPHQTLQ